MRRAHWPTTSLTRPRPQEARAVHIGQPPPTSTPPHPTDTAPAPCFYRPLTNERSPQHRPRAVHIVGDCDKYHTIIKIGLQ